tara:strand:- start:751 stop:957 length:207 start_codon:yes stop_codon:yes gene_type:complete
MVIECIKGIELEGGSLPIMQGEGFKLTDRDEMIFTAIEGASMNPGMEMQFSNKQLINNFKFIKFIVKD